MNKDELVKEFSKMMKLSHKIRMKQIQKNRFFGGEKGILFCIDDLIEENCEATPYRISERINVKRPTVTTSLNSLEEKGYIKRTLDKKDRRKFVISLTEKGRKCVVEEKQRREEELCHIVESLGKDDTEKLLELSNKVINILNRYYN